MKAEIFSQEKISLLSHVMAGPYTDTCESALHRMRDTFKPNQFDKSVFLPVYLTALSLIEYNEAQKATEGKFFYSKENQLHVTDALIKRMNDVSNFKHIGNQTSVANEIEKSIKTEIRNRLESGETIDDFVETIISLMGKSFLRMKGPGTIFELLCKAERITYKLIFKNEIKIPEEIEELNLRWNTPFPF